MLADVVLEIFLPSLSNIFKIVTNCLDVMQWMFSEAMECENKTPWTSIVTKLTSRI